MRTLGGTALASAAGFGVVAYASATRASAKADHKVQRRAALPEAHPVRRAAEAIAPLGKWWAYMPLAMGVGAWLLAAPGFRRTSGGGGKRRPRRRPGLAMRAPGAATVLVAGTIATALSPLFDVLLPQPPAPPGRRTINHPVFPSGHALGPAAVAATSAYVLAREGLVRPAIGVPVALALPLATVAERVVGKRHWASDVVGGWLAGAAIAAGCLVAYESTRED